MLLKNLIEQIIIKMETIHPEYDLYVSCKCGDIIFLNRKVIMNGHKGKMVIYNAQLENIMN